MTFSHIVLCRSFFFFFQAEDGIRDSSVTGVQTCALPISSSVLAELAGWLEASMAVSVSNTGRTARASSQPASSASTLDAASRPRFAVRGSGERRVGEEWRSRGSPDHLKKKEVDI